MVQRGLIFYALTDDDKPCLQPIKYFYIAKQLVTLCSVRFMQNRLRLSIGKRRLLISKLSLSSNFLKYKNDS